MLLLRLGIGVNVSSRGFDCAFREHKCYVQAAIICALAAAITWDTISNTQTHVLPVQYHLIAQGIGRIDIDHRIASPINLSLEALHREELPVPEGERRGVA